MDQFRTEDGDVDLPPLHIGRGESGSTYCGYALSNHLTWIAEELVDQRAPNACPDCVGVVAAWEAA